jgi:Uma2 family endonuclease
MTVALQPTACPSVEIGAGIPDVPIFRLTVEQYVAMVETGILTEDDPVELLEGWLVHKMTKRPDHMVATGCILDLFPHVLPAGWFLNLQDPVTTPDSLPEPDAAVIRGTRRDYRPRRPAAADVGLVVEVADTTLRQDQGPKKRLYARAGIAVYWIVNLVDSRIEVYTEPSGPTEVPDYGKRQTYGPEDTIPMVLDGVEAGNLAVQDLLP